LARILTDQRAYLYDEKGYIIKKTIRLINNLTENSGIKKLKNGDYLYVTFDYDKQLDEYSNKKVIKITKDKALNLINKYNKNLLKEKAFQNLITKEKNE
jgi:hypothetical protein